MTAAIVAQHGSPSALLLAWQNPLTVGTGIVVLVAVLFCVCRYATK
jgi:hypothetical protein